VLHSQGDTSAGRGSWIDMLRRPSFLYAVFAVLVTTNVLSLTALLMAPEISTLFEETEQRFDTAQQERLLQLRMEVDRLHSRQYRQQGDMNLQMQELTQQQEFLAEQHTYVRALADKARELGLGDAQIQVASAEPDVMTTSSMMPGGDIDEISANITRMLDESRLALGTIEDAAARSTGEIVGELAEVGIDLALEAAEGAVGGPFIPATSGNNPASLAESANRVMAELERFDQARRNLADLPIHYPFASRQRISSRYGNRRDPFNRSVAFHSGLDFAAPSGTDILSVGDGKVIFAARRSGYGNVLEIRHADGIVTRYAHMSRILVRKGQTVEAGEIVAKVGSTGRSTGPHLHLEFRRDDRPQNPAPFLEVSRRLSAYLG